MIRFLLDRELIELSDVAADLTVLDWLRIERQRTGTKEGCGSGDCGACTVVIASVALDEESHTKLTYQTLNSCITFVGALHGKQLLTVESLASGSTLHPVQQCMVEEHGSQCGFCTPGFVMSLYALYQQDEAPAVLKGQIDQALGGNLCRCTGYRPIKRAAEKALDHRGAARSVTSDVEADIISRLQQLAKEPAMASSTNANANANANDTSTLTGFYQPDKLIVLADLYLQHPDARLLAGGTDLALEVTQQMKELPLILSVNAVPELKSVAISDSQLQLGSAVSLSECMKLMQKRIPGAHELLLRFGSDQVRNQGTVGGNIGSASPIGDLPPLLMALNATLILQRGADTRELPLASHFLGYRKTTLHPGEFIRAVSFELPQANAVFAVHKISKRHDDDISTVCMAIHLPQSDGRIQDSRIAFGGMAATPVRAVATEAVFNGAEFNSDTVAKAQQTLANELSPISDARASAEYRLQVAQNLLQRVWLQETSA